MIISSTTIQTIKQRIDLAQLGAFLSQFHIKTNLLKLSKDLNLKILEKKIKEFEKVEYSILFIIKNDKTFEYTIKAPVTSGLLKTKIFLRENKRNIYFSDVKKIAQLQLSVLNTHDLNKAIKIISGSLKSMKCQIITKINEEK